MSWGDEASRRNAKRRGRVRYGVTLGYAVPASTAHRRRAASVSGFRREGFGVSYLGRPSNADAHLFKSDAPAAPPSPPRRHTMWVSLSAL